MSLGTKFTGQGHINHTWGHLLMGTFERFSGGPAMGLSPLASPRVALTPLATTTVAAKKDATVSGSAAALRDGAGRRPASAAASVVASAASATATAARG